MSTLLVDRQQQNEKGAKIVHFSAYFTSLMLRLGKGKQYNYIGAKQAVRAEFHIFVCIK